MGFFIISGFLEQICVAIRIFIFTVVGGLRFNLKPHKVVWIQIHEMKSDVARCKVCGGNV